MPRLTKDDITPREELVLLALAGKELYGMQIPQAIEEASGGLRKMGIGSLYPVLHLLEEKALIQSRWGDERSDDRKHARRCYYTLTDAGNAAVESIQSFRANLIIWKPA